jgi:hypothetical protein
VFKPDQRVNAPATSCYTASLWRHGAGEGAGVEAHYGVRAVRLETLTMFHSLLPCLVLPSQGTNDPAVGQCMLQTLTTAVALIRTGGVASVFRVCLPAAAARCSSPDATTSVAHNHADAGRQ